MACESRSPNPAVIRTYVDFVFRGLASHKTLARTRIDYCGGSAITLMRKLLCVSLCVRVGLAVKLRSVCVDLWKVPRIIVAQMYCRDVTAVRSRGLTSHESQAYGVANFGNSKATNAQLKSSSKAQGFCIS